MHSRHTSCTEGPSPRSAHTERLPGKRRNSARSKRLLKKMLTSQKVVFEACGNVDGLRLTHSSYASPLRYRGACSKPQPVALSRHLPRCCARLRSTTQNQAPKNRGCGYLSTARHRQTLPCATQSLGVHLGGQATGPTHRSRKHVAIVGLLTHPELAICGASVAQKRPLVLPTLTTAAHAIN